MLWILINVSPMNMSLSGHPLLYASHRFQTQSYNQEEQHEQGSTSFIETKSTNEPLNCVDVVTILQTSCFGTRSSGDYYLCLHYMVRNWVSKALIPKRVLLERILFQQISFENDSLGSSSLMWLSQDMVEHAAMVLEACQSSESLDVVLDLKDFQLRHSARLCNLAQLAGCMTL